ncbi:MAG: SMC-Scp complex subunit ScpB [Candidatus Paceibacterota bacterium]|jgi:segregation and condensation protein B
MNLDSKIEAILFFKGEPMSVKKMAGIFNETEENILSAISTLQKRLADTNSGLTVIQKDNEVALGTNKDASEIIKNLTKEELQKDLGRAGLETLATIIYHGPISKSRIDYIRGVNSGYILRNLLIRGLVERDPDPIDQRSFLYKPTLDLMRHLGVSKIEERPEFGQIKQELDTSIQQLDEMERRENNSSNSSAAPSGEQQNISQ